MQTLKEQIDRMFAEKRYDEIEQLICANEKEAESDNDIVTLYYLIPVYRQEKAAGKITLFEKVGTLDNLLERYTKLKFYLRRIDFGITNNRSDEFYAFISANRISAYEIVTAIRYSVVHKEKVMRILEGK